MSKYTKIAVGLTGDPKEIIEISGKDLLPEWSDGDLNISDNDENVAVFTEGHWRYWHILEKTEEPETATPNS